jgi:hypothetical protein
VTEPFSKFRWNDHPVRVSLKDTPSALATVMFNKANPDGTKVYGSQENLAEMLKVSKKTVGRAQKQLESLGLIRRISTGSGFGRQSNEFALTMPPPIEDIAIEDMASSQVVSIEDIPPIEDIGVLHRGHGCPPIGDTGVPPIDPLPDPGNKPGSVEEPDIFDVRPQEEDIKSDVLPRDPFSEAYIFDDRPVDEEPVTLEESPEPTFGLVGGHSDVRLGDVPESGTSSKIHQPATEGTQPMSYDPSDPFAPVGARIPDPWPPEPTETRPEPQPVSQKQADGFLLHPMFGGSQADWDAAHVPIPWPTGKPFVHGEFDPFATYIDEATGEELKPYR